MDAYNKPACTYKIKKIGYFKYTRRRRIEWNQYIGIVV